MKVTSVICLKAMENPPIIIGTVKRRPYYYLASEPSKESAEDLVFSIHHRLGFNAIKRKVSDIKWDVYVAKKWC
jgi:hypothetical protein